MMGRVNTSVFPEPVKAMPIMSRPDRLQTKNKLIQNITNKNWEGEDEYEQLGTYMVGMP